MHIVIKRIYEAPEDNDGTRVLVDRLWPRGLTKDEAAIDRWAKDLTPSTELREWFGHDPNKHGDFCRKYRHELQENQQAVDDLLRRIDKRKRLTLLTASKHIANSHMPTLKKFLEQR